MKRLALIAALALLSAPALAAPPPNELPSIPATNGVVRATPSAIIIPEDPDNPGGSGCVVGSTGCDLPTSGGGGGTSDVNLIQVDGADVATGAGASDAGTQRVVTATDSTIGTVTNPVGIKGGNGSTINGAANATYVQPGTGASFAVVPTPAISAVTGSVSAATITSSSAQVVAAASRRLLAIVNQSTTATIACAFGATAVISAAGSFDIPPGMTRTWSAYPVPADAVNCISSAATSAATVEAN